MRALPLLILIILAGCSFKVPQAQTDNDCDDDTEVMETFFISAERITDGKAQLNVEFVPNWGSPGDYGWHMPFFWDQDDELRMQVEEDVVEEIVDAITDFSLDDVTCVRFNISYGNDCESAPDGEHCRWLCEGNGDSAHMAADVQFDWFSEDWTLGTWSDPLGQGCSALACSSDIYDITNQ